MHAVLEKIANELDTLVVQLNASIPSDEPFSLAHSNWSYPGVSRAELIKEAETIAALLRDQGLDALGTNEAIITDYVRRLQFLRTQTVPQIWGNASAAVPTYFTTLLSLRGALGTALSADDKAEAASTLKRVTAQLRAMEARLRDLDPRTEAVVSMLGRIEQAYDAADQLPTDLEALEEARQKVAGLAKDAEIDRVQLQASKGAADEFVGALKSSSEEAEAVLARCESAYSAATSQGLAAAFAERSQSLNKSMWAWVGGLVLALLVGGYFGSQHLRDLAALTKLPSTSSSAVFASMLLSLLAIGGPVWFAWLATKQIGQRFRLSEDYAFKASVSRAYEGYRREAARIDPDMEAELLRSALARLDELPLRLVDPVSHGSPWHELLSSEVVKDAAKSVPGFAASVTAMANNAVRRGGRTRPSGESAERSDLTGDA